MVEVGTQNNFREKEKIWSIWERISRHNQHGAGRGERLEREGEEVLTHFKVRTQKSGQTLAEPHGYSST